MSEVWALRSLRWSYCAFIAAASALALQLALHGQGEGTHGAHMVLALASTETIAALAFLFAPAQRVACAVLIVVYAIATVLSVLSVDWLAVLRFVFYGVTAVYIVIASAAVGTKRS
jgi:hypothetical protein